MFEKEINFISDFTLNRIKKLGSFITFEKISSAEIHPAIILYISGELDFLIYEDRQKLLSNSVFDYSSPEISRYFNLIHKEIKKIKRISFGDLRKLVVQAVSFNVNYLVRPKWSLIKLMYNQEQVKPVSEIEITLGYLYHYDYYKEIIGSYLRKRKLTNLSVTEFELILNKIDRELTVSHQKLLVDEALYLMADFFNEGGFNKTKIPVHYVEYYLKEKGFIELVIKLRKVIPAGTKQQYEVDDLLRIIYSKTVIDPATIAPVSTESSEPEPVVEEKILSSDEVAGDEIVNVSEESVETPVLTDQKTGDNLVEEKAIEEEIVKEEIIEEEKSEQIKIKEESEKAEETRIIETDEEKIPVEEESIIPVEEPKINTEIEEISSDELEEILKDVDETPEEELKPLSPAEEQELLQFFDSELSKETEEIDAALEEMDLKIDDGVQSPEVISTPETDIDQEKIEMEEMPNDSETEIISEDLFTELDELEEMVIDETGSEPEPETDFKELKEGTQSEIFEEAKKDYSSEPKTEPKKTVRRAKPISRYLNDREMEKIVSAVFADDSEDFVTTLERISECNDFKEAEEILKAVFTSYKVSSYSKEAVLLSNAVSNYFYQV